MPKKKTQKYTIEPLFIAYMVIAATVILTALSLFIQHKQFRSTMPNNTYQAVFLTNGQVYFGKMTPLNRSYMALQDVYYIQQDTPVVEEGQTTEEGNDVQALQQQAESQFAVVRLGEELHQPQNGLVINTKQILFWENLQGDSRVIEAIREEKSQ